MKNYKNEKLNIEIIEQHILDYERIESLKNEDRENVVVPKTTEDDLPF